MHFAVRLLGMNLLTTDLSANLSALAIWLDTWGFTDPSRALSKATISPVSSPVEAHNRFGADAVFAYIPRGGSAPSPSVLAVAGCGRAALARRRPIPSSQLLAQPGKAARLAFSTTWLKMVLPRLGSEKRRLAGAATPSRHYGQAHSCPFSFGASLSLRARRTFDLVSIRSI